MRRFLFCYLCVAFCGWLTTPLFALPSPADLKKSEKKHQTTRAKSSPTPKPLRGIPVSETTEAAPSSTTTERETATQSAPSTNTRDTGTQYLNRPAPSVREIRTQTTNRPTSRESSTQVSRPSTTVRETSAQTNRPSAPVRETSAQGPRPSTVVVIDAGHGGFDRGGIAGQRVPEKVMNLDVSQRLKAILVASGYRVVMTRDSDVFVPLPTRVAIANSNRNAIFVCIHFNSATRSGANGIETYFFSRESLPLASAIHYYVAGGAPSSNRGVRRRGYYVLRRTTIPAVLVECGFLTNPSEAQYAQSVNYRQKLAEEIARGIRNRGSVGTSSSTARVASTSPAVPLQPFIDQTRVRDPDLTHSKHSSKKSSKSKSSKSKKKSSSSDSDTEKTTSKKKTTKKHSESRDDDSAASPKKKKPSKKSED